MSIADNNRRVIADASAGLDRVTRVHRLWKIIAIAALLALAVVAALTWMQRSGRALLFVPAFGVLGLAIGVVAGAVATWAVGHFAQWPVSMTAASILLAAGFFAAGEFG